MHPTSATRWIGAMLAAALGACIERPPNPHLLAASLDRTALTEVLANPAPATATPIGAEWDEGVLLRSVLLPPGPYASGQELEVVAYWGAQRSSVDEWTVFAHVDGAGADTRTVFDHPPAGGRYPTAAWRAGDVIADRFGIRLPAQAGKVELWIGLFRSETRLKVRRPGAQGSDGQGRVRIATLPVTR